MTKILEKYFSKEYQAWVTVYAPVKRRPKQLTHLRNAHRMKGAEKPNRLEDNISAEEKLRMEATVFLAGKEKEVSQRDKT